MKCIISSFFLLFFTSQVVSQDNSSQVDLSKFELANVSSPAFVLINESPTEVYIPDNLQELTIHALNNLSGSLSLEVTPYYFLNTKSKDRTFFKYIGIEKNGNDYRQNWFSGINTTTLSFAYANKEFENLTTENNKVFSIGLRTKILRVYSTREVLSYYSKISDALQNLQPGNAILIRVYNASTEEEKTKILNEYYQSKLEEEDVYKKPIKPIFQLDGAIGYSSLFTQNKIDAATVNRFGAWLTSEFSLILNRDLDESERNNYLNAYVITRYVEDEFNLNSKTLFYRDLGVKLEVELGRISLGYEYIDRNGSVDSERSVGTIKYLIKNNISLTGGFGKDYTSDDNLVSLFGVNWGINFGN